MEPVFEIDCSKQYKQGTSFVVVSDGTYGLFIIKFNKGGSIPDMLSGSYSSAVLAKRAAEQYISMRDAAFDVKGRRDAVRIDKVKHVSKQEAKSKEV